MADPFRVAVLISGGGTTLRNLLAVRDAGQLPVEFALVVSSNPKAGGLEYAQRAGIDCRIVQRGECESAEDFSETIFGACRSAGAQLVVMGGFLKHVLIPPDFENRVINIHPALIPAFCGPGMYGGRVHSAVLQYGAKVSGCTVHFVDNQYDHGPVIYQRTVPVFDDDTPEKLAARVFEAECEALPAVIRSVASGKVHVKGRIVKGAAQ